MTRSRVAVAAAAIVTALLLQATVVGPVTSPWPVSLPAVLVAAVALADGPATGMSFGFVTGLVADLGSAHPAGVLALVWLGVGMLCGLVADHAGVRRDAVTAGCVCGLASSLATVLLTIVHAGTSLPGAVTGLIPAVLGDVLLAFALVALTRRMLRTDALRAPHPAHPRLTAPAPDARRG